MREALQDGSTAVTAVRRSVDRLRSAVDGSRLFGVLPTHGSSSDDTTSETDSRRAAVLRNSTIGATWTGLKHRIATAASTARVTGAGAALRTSVEGSFCYRWLTAEPDPDVIVIDLRETLTLGPPLRAIQRSLEALAPSVATARLTDAGRTVASTLRARPIRIAGLALLGPVVGGIGALAASGDPGLIPVAALVALGLLAALGVRSKATWDDVRESRIVTALAAAFEPPEPPARTGTDVDNDDADCQSPRPSGGRDNESPD